MWNVIMKKRVTFTFSFHFQSNFVTRNIKSDCCKTHELNQILDKYHLLLQIQSMKWRCPSKECACLNICWSRRWVPLHLEHVWAYLQAAVTIHLGWQYLHLLGGAAQCWPGWASSWPGCPHWHRREQPSSSVNFVTLRIIWIEISRFTNSLFSNKSSVAAIFYY